MKYLAITFIVLLLAIGPVIASHRQSPYVFLPKNESSSIKNIYNVLSWSIAKEFLKKESSHTKTFLPYRIQDLNTSLPKTIVVIMGESLGAKYMSLYGFHKETTPFLKNITSNFYYTWGYSAGVNTDVSVPTFFLLKREPENNFVFLKQDTNLFHIAKQQGYTTHYITTQKLTILGAYIADFTDIVKSKKNFSENGNRFDQCLVDYLNSIDTTHKNFIVLHQRNSHSPYDKHIPSSFHYFAFKNKPYKEYMRNSYFNSLRYTDSLYDQIITWANKQQDATVVFFTSDHSEMMGYPDEKGRFGHGFLGKEDAKVPMMLYINEKARYLTSLLSLKHVISHYQFGLLIAKALGKRIINPNDDGTYFINGVDIGGEKGYIPYKKRDKL